MRLTTTRWTEYNAGTKRVQKETVPSSTLTAEAVSVDGFVLSQSDHAGICSTQSRQYTASGMVLTQTGGRGNTTTLVTDKAGRTLSSTDATGATTTTAYEATSDQPASVAGINMVFVVVVFFLNLCLYFCIGTGCALFSCWQGENLIQGELTQKIQVACGVAETCKIEFKDKQGNNNHFYQCFSRPFDKPSGSTLCFYISEEGLLLKDLVWDNVFVFLCSSFLSIILFALFIIIGMEMSTKQISCRKFSKCTQLKLFMLRLFMLALGGGGMAVAANRIHTDFFLPEEKAVVSSVEYEYYCVFSVKALGLTSGLVLEREWQPSVSQSSPATGQELKIVSIPNSEPEIARVLSGKAYTIVLLGIALMYTGFTTAALVRRRTIR